MNAATTAPLANSRLDHLDAVRAFALLLGIFFHASLSLMPIFIGWAVMDVSTSSSVLPFILWGHSFRMEVFFLVAGFFSHLSFHGKGPGTFLKTRFVRIVVPFVAGWFILRPLLVSGWTMGAASLRGDVDIWAGLRGGFQSMATLPSGLFVGSHLWFLYYLAMITVAALVIRAALKMSGSWHVSFVAKVDAILSWLAASRISLFALVVPTAALLWSMRGWSVDTPDQTLRPHLPVALLYGGFFGFGWLLHRTAGLLSQFSRLSATRWLIAGASIVATLRLAAIEGDPGHPHYALAHVGFNLSYATMMWSSVFLTIGVFERVVRQPIAIVRFVADSSYWMYLIHLPIVVWLQVAMAELPWHWSIKLTAISVATITVSLFTYDLFVRSTIIGRILNGRRRERVLFTLGTKRNDSTNVLVAGND